MVNENWTNDVTSQGVMIAIYLSYSVYSLKSKSELWLSHVNPLKLCLRSWNNILHNTFTTSYWGRRKCKETCDWSPWFLFPPCLQVCTLGNVLSRPSCHLTCVSWTLIKNRITWLVITSKTAYQKQNYMVGYVLFLKALIKLMLFWIVIYI